MSHRKYLKNSEGKNAKNRREREYGFVTQEVNNNNHHQWMRGYEHRYLVDREKLADDQHRRIKFWSQREIKL